VVGAFVQSLFVSNFVIGHRTLEVISEFCTFVSDRSSACLWVIGPMNLESQLTAVFMLDLSLLAEVSLTSA
jgi:hypothetical protein